MPIDETRADWVNHCSIRTFSGKDFFLHGTDPREIDIDDIAHALSMVTRFTGHISRPYSVAEHSILVMMIVKHMGGSIDNLLQALMHDATEAYLSDIAAPFKDELVNYRTLEGRVAARIFERFDIDPNFPKIIKDADWIALFVEAISLAPRSQPEDWVCWDKYGDQAKQWLEQNGAIPQDLLHPLEMKQMFLNVFDALIDERADENVRQLI